MNELEFYKKIFTPSLPNENNKLVEERNKEISILTNQALNKILESEKEASSTRYDNYSLDAKEQNLHRIVPLEKDSSPMDLREEYYLNNKKPVVVK